MKKNEENVILDLLPLYSGAKEKIEFSFLLFPEFSKGTDLNFKDGVAVSGSVVQRASGKTKEKGFTELRISEKGVYHTRCARCCEDVCKTLDISGTQIIVSKLQDDEEDENYILACDDKINLTQTASEFLFCNLPYKVLCKDGCKGLCPMCGENLNTGSCRCKNENIDPRLAILKKLLDK